VSRRKRTCFVISSFIDIHGSYPHLWLLQVSAWPSAGVVESDRQGHRQRGHRHMGFQVAWSGLLSNVRKQIWANYRYFLATWTIYNNMHFLNFNQVYQWTRTHTHIYILYTYIGRGIYIYSNILCRCRFFHGVWMQRPRCWAQAWRICRCSVHLSWLRPGGMWIVLGDGEVMECHGDNHC
jgi:hypothetical protein